MNRDEKRQIAKLLEEACNARMAFAYKLLAVEAFYQQELHGLEKFVNDNCPLKDQAVEDFIAKFGEPKQKNNTHKKRGKQHGR